MLYSGKTTYECAWQSYQASIASRTTPPHPTEVGEAVAWIITIMGDTFIVTDSEKAKLDKNAKPLYIHPAPAAVDDANHSEDARDMVKVSHV